MPGRMAGRVALVTGGGGGIGEATGQLFVEEGAAVVLVDVDKSAAERAAASIGAAVAGARVLALAADVAPPGVPRIVLRDGPDPDGRRRAIDHLKSCRGTT